MRGLQYSVSVIYHIQTRYATHGNYGSHCVYNSTGFSGNRKLNIFTQFRTSQPVPHTGLSLREWVLCLQFNRILGEPQTEHTQFHNKPACRISETGSLGDGLLTNRKVDGTMVHHTRVGFVLLLRPFGLGFQQISVPVCVH